MLDSIFREVQGHGPIHLLLSSAAKIGFVWNSEECGWSRPSQGSLHLLAGPWQVYKDSILRAWQKSFFAGLQGGVVGVFSLHDREGSLKLFLSSYDRERDKALFMATLAGRCLQSVSFRSECVESLYLVDFAVGQMVIFIFSGNALHPPPSSSQGES